MKKKIILFILVIILFIFTSCGEKVGEDMMWVGKKEYGYVQIPKGYEPYKDENFDEDIDVLQYIDPYGYNVVTITSTADAEETPEEVISFIILALNEQGAEDIGYAQIEIDGIEAWQGYGSLYDEDGFKYLYVYYVFNSEDGHLHYIAIEGLYDDIYDLSASIETTYKLEK